MVGGRFESDFARFGTLRGFCFTNSFCCTVSLASVNIHPCVHWELAVVVSLKVLCLIQWVGKEYKCRQEAEDTLGPNISPGMTRPKPLNVTSVRLHLTLDTCLLKFNRLTSLSSFYFLCSRHLDLD